MTLTIPMPSLASLLPSQSDRIRALVYEVDPLWAHAHTQILEDYDCVVTRVTSADDALLMMQACYFHIVILMDQDNTLLNEIYLNQWFDHTVVCVCSERVTAYDLTYWRKDDRSTGIRLNEVLYFSKGDYYPRKFWGRIYEELKHKDLFGRLQIERPDYIEDLSYQMTANLIDHIESDRPKNELLPQDMWIKRYYEVLPGDDESRFEALRSRVKYEIFDMLRRCVRGYRINAIQLKPIVNGLSKAAVIGVTPKIDGKLGKMLVFKLGYHKEIMSESHAYENHVQFMLDRAPKADQGPRTPLLSSMVYHYVERGKSFGEIYRDDINFTTMDIEGLLNDLFRNTYKAWLRTPAEGMVEAVDYTGYLGCQIHRFYDAISHIEQQLMMHRHRLWDVDRFQLPGITGLFPNPFNYLDDENFLTMLNFPAPNAITHGDLNASNILIRNNTEAWLIDFARTDNHHALRDFIQLETVVRFALMDGATLAERHEMESYLASQRKFSHILKIRDAYIPAGENEKQLERAFKITCKIRELAWETVLNNTDDTYQIAGFQQYQMGLFFMSLATVRFVKHKRSPNGLTTVQALHALLAASLLGKQLARMM